MRGKILRHLAINTGPNYASDVSSMLPRVGLGRKEGRPTPRSWHGRRGEGRAGRTAGTGERGGHGRTGRATTQAEPARAVGTGGRSTTRRVGWPPSLARTSRCSRRCRRRLGNARSRAPKGIPSLLEHATVIEKQLERHGPGESTVDLSLTDDVFLRSDNWARWQLGIPLPWSQPSAGANHVTRRPNRRSQLRCGIPLCGGKVSPCAGVWRTSGIRRADHSRQVCGAILRIPNAATVFVPRLARHVADPLCVG